MTVITLANGLPFDFSGETIANVTPEVVALSLSQQCRYAGHTPYFYSVAEHSVHVSDHVDRAYRFAALMHDAHEAVVQDIVRPLKTDHFREFEAMVQRLFERHFGFEVGVEVMRADDRMLASEGREFFGDDVTATWGLSERPFRRPFFRLRPDTPEKARRMWLAVYAEHAPDHAPTHIPHLYPEDPLSWR